MIFNEYFNLLKAANVDKKLITLCPHKLSLNEEAFVSSKLFLERCKVQKREREFERCRRWQVTGNVSISVEPPAQG